MATDSVFARFAPFLQDFIYRAEWKTLRPVQIAAAQAVFDTQADVLITAGTASGKTEAAFLPILSLIHETIADSVQVLYVGPLRALINDQFRRLDTLCEAAQISVHRWHGDVGQSHKAMVIDQPSGILQITPESIESLLINRQDKLPRLFRSLKYVVIDELHTFLGTDRGLQLASQLNRLARYTHVRPRRLGLSATVGDADVAKRWLNPSTYEQVIWINPPNANPDVRLSHLHFTARSREIPFEVVDDTYQLTRNRKTLIFCNSRHDVESLTEQLNKYCARDRLSERYYPHHGSISKEMRELAESRMKDDERPASVVCTSTLELGIDIGQLDLVVQVNATHTASSFAQRLGRSGRREQGVRTMQIYSTQTAQEADQPFYERLPFNLLKALAVTDLFRQGWVEPPDQQDKPYNVLYHQLLSYLVERHGATPRELVASLSVPGPFESISLNDFAELLQHLASIDHIQQMPDGQLILGLAGEKVVRSREFYALFQASIDWEVMHGTRNLGRISPTSDLQPAVCLLLGGKVWEVTELIPAAKQVLVKPAHQSQQTLFKGTSIPDTHPIVSRQMRFILSQTDIPAYLSGEGVAALGGARQMSQGLDLGRREIFRIEQEWAWLPWAGTRVTRTLRLLLKRLAIEVEFAPLLFPWVLLLKFAGDFLALRGILDNVLASRCTGEELIKNIAIDELLTHKFDQFLPEMLVRKRAVEEWIDIEGAYAVLQNTMRVFES